MRLYEPAVAASYTKIGPKNKYRFKRGIATKPLCDEDNVWMATLVATGMLKFAEETSDEMIETLIETVKEPGLTLKNMLPHTKADVIREKGYKTPEVFAAEIAVAKSEAKMKAIGDAQIKEEFSNQSVKDFFDFLKMCQGDSEEEMMRAVKAEYLEEPIVALCEYLHLPVTGEKPELIRNLIDWFSEEHPEELTKPEPAEIVEPIEEIIEKPKEVIEEVIVEKIVEPIEEVVEEVIDGEIIDETLPPDAQKLHDFIKGLSIDMLDTEVIEAIKGEYKAAPLVSLCATLNLDSEGNKTILAGRLFDKLFPEEEEGE